MNNVFIIMSPLQLLNCIEAQHYFKTKHNLLIVFKTQEAESLNQIEQLLKIFRWDKIIYINLPNKFIKHLTYIKLIKKETRAILNEKIKKIFVGDYRSIHVNHLVNYLKNGSNIKYIYLVDDGMSTLSYQRYYKKASILNVKNLIYQIFFYKLNKIEYIFFSCFKIKDQKVIENNFNFIKKLIKNSQYENTVFFIGQPLIELSIVNQDYFKEYMKRIIHFFYDKKFIFILHRKNDKKIIEALSHELNFEYLEFNNLLELEILQRNQIPCTIATFYSTAIYNLNKLFPNINYFAFKIKEKDINNIFLPILDIDNYYKEFEDANISVNELIK